MQRATLGITRQRITGMTALLSRGAVGMATTSNASVDKAKAGEISIDFTPATGNSSFRALEDKQVVEPLGTQPATGAAVWASEVASISTKKRVIGADGVVGTDRTSYTKGVVGTDDVVGTAQ
jgi:hypothetical protein